MTAAILARMVLAAVFVVAGVSKAWDGPGTRRAVIGFGISDRWAPVVATVLPGAELLTALLLLVPATARAGGVAALGLLVAFSVAIGVNLARGRRPECACFGQVRSEPVGPRLLIRNGALAILAAIVIAGGPSTTQPSLWAELALRSGADQVLAVSMAALAGVVVVLAVRLRSVQRELDALAAAVAEPGAAPAAATEDALVEAEPPVFAPGLPIGATAPALSLPSLDGAVELGDLWTAGKPLVVLFVAPTCGTCHALLPKPSAWAVSYGDVLSFVLVTAGDADANAGLEDHLGGFGPVLLDPGSARQEYEVAATPAGVVVGRDGTIETATVYGVPEITMLVMQAAGTERSRAQADSSVA